MPRYATIEKHIGETPLVATERLRAKLNLPASTPLAYAGRLDPMASGKLLILIGNECKRQSMYHDFDKEYAFSVLFGIESDTHDVLGIVERARTSPHINAHTLHTIAHSFEGEITLPYPHFSAKTVQGKPLHVWTLEGKVHDIEVPLRTSRIYKLTPRHTETIPARTLLTRVLEKIETIPTVTEASKALGRDFRRTEVREAWRNLIEEAPQQSYTIAHFTCIASSGTYMRTLASEIAKSIGTTGLAYHIHRTRIGTYRPLWGRFGVWTRSF